MAGGSIEFSVLIASVSTDYTDFTQHIVCVICVICGRLEPDGGRLFDDVPVAHLYDPLTHGRGFRVVSDHDDGLVEAVIQLLKHVKDES